MRKAKASKRKGMASVEYDDAQVTLAQIVQAVAVAGYDARAE